VIEHLLGSRAVRSRRDAQDQDAQDQDVSTSHPITLDDIDGAAARIAPFIHRTDIMRCAAIDHLAGASVHLKAEHLQRSGSFKARGAHNKLLRLGEEARDRGVVAISSGNHAAAVACAGQRLGVRVDVYMPHDAPALKQRATAAYGATIHHFDRRTDDRAELMQAHVERFGSVPVEPYDDFDVMAGQGTIAREILEQADIDTLVVPMSGGGLMAGCAVAARELRPDLRLVGVEPAAADDTFRSFAAGERITIEQPDTVADGLAVTAPGRLTFPINCDLVDSIVTVTEAEILAACVLLFERAKQVVEPSGATALAAVLGGSVDGDAVAVVLSGGNIDLAQLAGLVSSQITPE
jgi:threonine dehydratase